MKQLYSTLLLFVAGSALSAQTATFNYTGGTQTFTVPACVTSLTVDVYGASGGNNGSYLGGSGGRVQATVPVTPGEVLEIRVGQVGVSTSTSNPPVYNGGGGVYSYVSAGPAGTGGGASDIRRAPNALVDRLVVAGGGGGGGYVNIGGHGGGLIGQDGIPYITFPNSGGKGGTQSAGGAAGVACCSCPTYTTAGASGQGGNGSGDGAGGGGGGGGYFGGGGSCFAGGGGGSSYTAATVTGVTHTQGTNIGNGQVVITYSASGSIPTTPTGFSGLNSVCTGSSGSYSIGSVIGATSYTWTVPSGATINSGQGTTSINVTFGSISGNVTVTADNCIGSSSPSTYTVTVNALPVVTLGPDATYCGFVNLDAGNAGSTFLWSAASTNQIINVTSSGAYSVNVTDAFGCSAADTVNITINQLPAVSLGNDIVQCGGSVTLDAGNVGALLYQWSDSSAAQTLSVTTSGTYYVSLLDANGCAGSDTVTVTIGIPFTATASAPSSTLCLADAAIVLTGTPVGGVWSGPAITINQFDPTAAGVGLHTLVYSYTDSATTCSDTAQVNILVDICLNTNSPSSSSSITVYPNPVTDLLQLQTSEIVKTYTITDIKGSVVMSGSFVSGQPTHINSQELAAGTYILNTVNDAGVSQSTQFVKK